MAEFTDLIKEAGYRRSTVFHYPITDHGEKQVKWLESLINENGGVRSKSPASSEYQYQYQLDGQTIVFHYRFGEAGLSAWWIQK